MHEIGHVLGLSDLYGDPAEGRLMSGWLNPGERLLPVWPAAANANVTLVGLPATDPPGSMG